MLCQLELLTLPRPRRYTFTSLCAVWTRQLGQNFLIANFSVWRFLFRVVV